MRPRPHSPARRLAASLAAALPLALCAPAARADAPPSRCAAGAPARIALDTSGGALTALAAAPDGDRVVLAARVLPAPRTRGATRVLLGELGPDGAWALPPRVVLELPGRDAGALELAVHEGARLLAVSTRRGVTLVRASADPSAEAPASHALEAPRHATGPAVFAAHAAGLTVAWPLPASTRVDRYDFAHDAPVASATAHLPRRTTIVGAAATAGGETTALVVRTSARRYYVALATPDGAVHWTSDAPAGCEGSRCPPVRLLPAADGYVAAWTAHPTRDRLTVPAARALDARGRVRGHEIRFVPVARGAVVVAAPDGTPRALQLGRPLVLRGDTRPIAVPTTEADYPSLALAWTDPADRGALSVLSATRGGELTLATVRCESPAPR